MVARTPPKQRKVLAPLNPVLLRETVKKVDKCMARLQELQYTVAGGTKVISGVSLSPRSTRGYLKASLRCKQESLRIKNAAAPKRSPGGKLPGGAEEEWRRMSLPAMLVGETIGEILQASQFAREIVAAAAIKTKKTTLEDPKTPVTQKREKRPSPENTELRIRRRKEKQNKLQSIRTESQSPSLQRARSRINFKVSSPPKIREFEKENNRYLANRVSPRNRPFAKKTVLFPNPLFHSTHSQSQQQKLCKTRSPVIVRNKQQTPHKFLIKSPPSASKFQVKIKSPPMVSISPTRPANLNKTSPKLSTVSISPTRPAAANLTKKSPKMHRSFSPSRFANRLVSPLRPNLNKKSPKLSTVSISPTRPAANLTKKSPKMHRSFSPSRFANRLVSPLRPKLSTASKFRRSFSPSRLANRLVSPLKSKKTVKNCDDGQVSGLKQLPTSIPPMRFSTGRF